MTIRDALHELREALVFDESYLLGFYCEPHRLVLQCELQPADMSNATGDLSRYPGEIAISGVEALWFDMPGKVGASGGGELDFGSLDLEYSDSGLSVHSAIGAISVIGRSLTVELIKARDANG